MSAADDTRASVERRKAFMDIERAVAEAVAAEREACAKVCLDLRCRWCRDLGEETNANHADCCACRDDAAAIRARGGAS